MKSYVFLASARIHLHEKKEEKKKFVHIVAAPLVTPPKKPLF